jgi:hypothetical protein
MQVKQFYNPSETEINSFLKDVDVISVETDIVRDVYPLGSDMKIPGHILVTVVYDNADTILKHNAEEMPVIDGG